MNLEWLGQTPKYKSGDKVFVVSTGNGFGTSSETTVRSVPCDFFVNEDMQGLIWCGVYDISRFVFQFESFPSWCHQKYIFSTKEEAHKMAKFWPVDWTDEEWTQCIGNRDKTLEEEGNIFEGCDLTIGSVNDGTSEIRSILMEVQKRKGIIEADRLQLLALTSNCYNWPEALDDENSLLSKLLKILDLKWSVYE